MSFEEPLQPSEIIAMLSSFYQRGNEVQRCWVPCHKCESGEVTLASGLARPHLGGSKACSPLQGGAERLC